MLGFILFNYESISVRKYTFCVLVSQELLTIYVECPAATPRSQGDARVASGGIRLSPHH
jgi:hypothetical protein